MYSITKITYIISFLLMFAVVIPASAQSNEIVIAPEIVVEYTEVTEIDTDNNNKIDKWSYIGDGTGLKVDGVSVPDIVATAYDTDNDGVANLWLVYNTDQTIKYEAHDTTGDGNADTIFEISASGEVVNISGEEAGKLDRVKTEIFIGGASGNAGLSDDELIGDISDLDKSSGGSSIVLYIIIVLAIAGFIYWKKRK